MVEGREGLIDLDHLRPRLAGHGTPGCLLPTKWPILMQLGPEQNGRFYVIRVYYM